MVLTNVLLLMGLFLQRVLLVCLSSSLLLLWMLLLLKLVEAVVVTVKPRAVSRLKSRQLFLW